MYGVHVNRGSGPDSPYCTMANSDLGFLDHWAYGQGLGTMIWHNAAPTTVSPLPRWPEEVCCYALRICTSTVLIVASTHTAISGQVIGAVYRHHLASFTVPKQSSSYIEILNPTRYSRKHRTTLWADHKRCLCISNPISPGLATSSGSKPLVTRLRAVPPPTSYTKLGRNRSGL